MDPEGPKPKFIKEVLLKCLRLSYHQRVKDVVPESFHSLVPELTEPFFKYTMPGSATTDVTDVMEQDTSK